LPEVVGDAALAVDPFDVDAIARAIRKLVNDTSLRRELSVKGLQRANEFNWRETARKTLAVYKEVTRQSVSPLI
jgi:glycosyltransferase involved in cell wall biosynthesis